MAEKTRSAPNIENESIHEHSEEIEKSRPRTRPGSSLSSRGSAGSARSQNLGPVRTGRETPSSQVGSIPSRPASGISIQDDLGNRREPLPPIGRDESYSGAEGSGRNSPESVTSATLGKISIFQYSVVGYLGTNPVTVNMEVHYQNYAKLKYLRTTV